MNMFIGKPRPRWWELHGWELVFRTNEKNHATPHFLIESKNGENSISVRISDGEIYDPRGNVPADVKKYASKIAANHKVYLFNYWEKHVDSAIPLEQYMLTQKLKGEGID